VRHNLVLAVLLVVTLGLKLVASAHSPAEDPAVAAGAVQRMLAQQGFASRVVEIDRSPKVYVAASRGECRIVAGDYPPHSTFRDVYAQLARDVGPVRFAYRGVLRDDEPKVFGLLDYFRWRELRRAGFAVVRRPIVAVAASPACRADGLPWDEVAELPA
jgi:hypothetical protein